MAARSPFPPPYEFRLPFVAEDALVAFFYLFIASFSFQECFFPAIRPGASPGAVRRV